MLARRGHLALVVVFFLSGMAALLFETVWFRLTGLLLGNGVWASSVVLAGFMSGLALGNLLAGRLGPRMTRPLHVYAMLELVIAVSGVGLVMLMPHLNALCAPLFDRTGPGALLNALRLVIAMALLIVPTTAMGATLPVMVKGLCARDASFGRVLGWLYGVNTLGAVAGALGGELLLIGALGLRATACIAGVADVIAAVVAMSLAQQVAIERAPPTAPRLSFRAIRLLAAAALAGGVLLAMEVIWFRLLLLFSFGSSHDFAFMLAVVLAGIGLGGLVGSMLIRAKADIDAVASTALLAAVMLMLCYGLSGEMHYSRDPMPTFTRAIRLIGPVALLSGVLFTLIGHALHRASDRTGAVPPDPARTAGYLTLANTIGAAAGALLGGFVLLPTLGMERALFTMAMVYVAIALLVRVRWVDAPALALVVVAAILFPHGHMQRDLYPRAIEPYMQDDTQLVATREGRSETIFYLRTDRFGEPYAYRMITNGISMSATHPRWQRYMKWYVYLPVALHPGPRDALLISYGVGVTAKALTDTASLQRIDVVDISRDVLEMNAIVYPDPAQHPLNDPRVHVHIEDGRFYLQTTRRRYDLITGEPPPPKAALIANLYSREYFQLIHDRLRDGGVVTYWLPMAQLSESDSRAIVRAFVDVFDHSSLWMGSGTNLMLLGIKGALPSPSLERFTAQWRDPAVAATMRDLGFESPDQVGAMFIADGDQLRAMMRGDLPLVDDHPYRLSPGPVTRRESLYPSWIDPDEALRRYRSSDHVRQLLPASCFKAAELYFRYRVIEHDLLTRDRIGAEPYVPLALYDVLTRTRLRTLPLWLMRTDPIEMRLATDVRSQADLALADRRYDEAASLYGAVADPAARYQQAFALHLAARHDDARAVDLPDIPGGERFRAFLEQVFAVSGHDNGMVSED